MIKKYLLVILVLVCCTEVSAQMGGMGGMGGRRGGVGTASQDHRAGPAREQQAGRPIDTQNFEIIDARMSMLFEDLKLDTQQLDTWKRLLETVRAYAADLSREKFQSNLSLPSLASELSPSALNHLAATANRLRDRLTAMEDIEIASQAFYKQLGEGQRRLFDIRLPMIIAPKSNNESALPADATRDGRDSRRRY